VKLNKSKLNTFKKNKPRIKSLGVDYISVKTKKFSWLEAYGYTVALKIEGDPHVYLNRSWFESNDAKGNRLSAGYLHFVNSYLTHPIKNKKDVLDRIGEDFVFAQIN
jgi:hypothetical protein